MNAQEPLDFSTFVAAVRRHAWLIVGIAVAAAVLAFGVSSLLPDRYDASANVLFEQAASPPQIDPDAPPPDVSAEPERIAATNLALASLDVVARRVQERVGSDESPEELRESVTIEPKGQADIAEVTAEAGTAREAARIANAFAFEVVALRREKAQDEIQNVIDAIEAQLIAAPPSAGLTSELEIRVEQLKVQKRLEAGDAEVVELALPPLDPSSPKPVRNAAIGGILGLILAVVLVLLLRRLDRGVRDEDEVAEIVDAPVIGRLPKIKETGWQHELAIEAFQFLRTNLQLGSRTADDRTFAVTSALPAEGKSTVVLGLAHALAVGGSSAILVDCDLRRPTLHSSLGLSGERGVTTALSSSARPGDLLQDTSIEGVRLLAAGPLTAMPGSLVAGGDHDVAALFGQLRDLADYVIVDTAPVTIGADASIIASRVDSTLMVVDAGAVEREVLVAAASQLRRAEAKVAGVVFNHADELLKSRAYQGYYGVMATGPAGGPLLAKRDEMRAQSSSRSGDAAAERPLNAPRQTRGPGAATPPPAR